jgi:hypothetical protein
MTPAPVPQEQHTDPPARSPRTRVGLFVGLPLLLVAVAVPLAVASRGAPVDQSYSAPGGDRVMVVIPNSQLDLVPSTDGDVHVEVSGWSSGPEPEFTVDTAADTTTIDGGCSGVWFARCDLDVRVALPTSATLDVTGTNGRITVSELDGDISLENTNGGLQVREVSGTLHLRTTNGAISVADCESDDVGATTTNGAIDLDFSDAPSTVRATSTNGGVTVRVPGQVPYFIDATTTNGGINTDALPSDRFADRTITVSTSNGAILVEPSER